MVFGKKKKKNQLKKSQEVKKEPLRISKHKILPEKTLEGKLELCSKPKKHVRIF